MLGALLVLMQCAAPREVAVVVTSRRGQSSSDEVAARVVSALRAKGVTVMAPDEATRRLVEVGGVDPQSCDGLRVCVKHLAQMLGQRGVVVGVDVAKAGRLTAAHLEALASDRLEPLAACDVNGDRLSFATQSAAAIDQLSEELSRTLAALDAQPPSVASPAVEPLPPPPAPALEAGPPVSAPAEAVAARPPAAAWRPRWLKWGGLGVSAAGAVAALSLTAAGADARSSYQGLLRDYRGGRANASIVPFSVLEARASQVNTDFVAALAVGLVSVSFIAATLWLFVTEQP